MIWTDKVFGSGISFWVQKFAETLEMPEILTDLEALILKRH
jgi:hypothetical protein